MWCRPLVCKIPVQTRGLHHNIYTKFTSMNDNKSNREIYWFRQIHEKKTKIRRAMLRWFTKHARDLPWRRSRDPYPVWLSEIMLQQTRVETAIPYFERFMTEFPTIESLAQAKEDRVLKLWEGLGYYSRARNLHLAAKVIVKEYGGQFPKASRELSAIPGIGRYTAGAIASIAFGEQTPVLDGNVKRVFSRLFRIEECIDEGPVIQQLWELAELLVPRERPGDFNQALMELGARICIPRNPDCPQCPVKAVCKAFAQDVQKTLPIRRQRKAVPHHHIVAAAIRKNGRYLLGKRPPKSMLGGLWEFPGGKVENGETHEDALKRELQEELEIDIEVGDNVISVNHAYSHFSITLHVYRCEHIAGKPQKHYHTELKWVPRSQFERYAMPAADLKFLHLL